MKDSKNEANSAPANTWRRDFAVAYLIFGFLHETAHVLTANFLGHEASIISLGVLLLRASQIPALEAAHEWEIQLVNHSGWAFSVILAMLAHVACERYGTKWSFVRQAATVTAVEGICTDLFGFGVAAGKTTFFCGNFGIILLSKSWTDTPDDYGKTALDLLQKMIQITMMRGAQTGGCVTWVGGNAKKYEPPKAIRSRVVNGKRTDLSEGIRKLMDKDICSGGKMNPSIQCLLGHTRFATSSKATMDGTHPHQWSPPQKVRVYPLDDRKLWKSSTSPKPVIQEVSNFVTHNGDLDFFVVNGDHADLGLVQTWLAKVTGHPLPAPVDSVAIAGLVDIIRSAGCFSLSIRYAHLIASQQAKIDAENDYPKFKDYEKFAALFEKCMAKFCGSGNTLSKIKAEESMRLRFCRLVYSAAMAEFQRTGETAFSGYEYFEVDEEAECGQLLEIPLFDLIHKAVDAFFDNDLMETTKIFLKGAVGSFGIMVTSSLDAHRQICIAARGQPMSIAFYPDKGIICYGSELAAVKAGMTFENPSGDDYKHVSSSKKFEDMTLETCRFDLDDLGGEVALIDFSGGEATVKTFQEAQSAEPIRARITPLKGNEFLLPLTPDKEDPILYDIQSIPAVLHDIQENWQSGGLNRMTAWHLGKKLGQRLRGRAAGKYGESADILVTGCEVSLWLAEQFASDLRKSFPKLRVQATSSNKLLGVFGQELSVPSIGHSMSINIPDLKNTIVIIVSHSGGTFGPLAISNLLQSVTRNLFVVSSEWDTQIGKQLRAMTKTDEEDFLASRVFTTDIGVRPAEPCSLSVVATHQLLTQIFEYVSLTILRDHESRELTGAVITYQDLQILERCNQEVILALERTVGVDVKGEEEVSALNDELKSAGDLWADHVLECAKAYMMSIVYILVTVTIGYPLVTGLATAAGLNASWAFYFTRFVDGVIYIGLPQINVTILRLIQRRNLLHRMTGRTVVIGDVPWVSQAADAFLSKIFARSYSIAGLSVLSGNPSDHLVHRHTHRVTRGSLLVCGRPDGRLTALTSAECAVNLSVNQASSIQSMGGTCESITIGHNPSKLGLTERDIALSTSRPKFLCEQLLDSTSVQTNRKRQSLISRLESSRDFSTKDMKSGGFFKKMRDALSDSTKSMDSDDQGSRSSATLKGAYLSMKAQSSVAVLNSHREKLNTRKESIKRKSTDLQGYEFHTDEFNLEVEQKSKAEMILQGLLERNKKSKDMKEIFLAIDQDCSGVVDMEEFIQACTEMNNGLTREDAEAIFQEADFNGSGGLDYPEFEAAMQMQDDDILRKLRHREYRDEKGIMGVQPSKERYFGATLYSNRGHGISSFSQESSQHFSMELYESRIASMERFVALCVMFHQLGKRVQDFFPKVTFGLMNYKMERTHSIMRIATTASPVSGDAVRDMMEILRLQALFQNSAQTIQNAWKRSEQRKFVTLKREDSERTFKSRQDSERSLRSGLDETVFTLSRDQSVRSLTSVDMAGRTKLGVVAEAADQLAEDDDDSDLETDEGGQENNSLACEDENIIFSKDEKLNGFLLKGEEGNVDEKLNGDVSNSEADHNDSKDEVEDKSSAN